MDHERLAVDCQHKVEAAALRHTLNQLGYRRCTACAGSGMDLENGLAMAKICPHCSGAGWVSNEAAAVVEDLPVNAAQALHSEGLSEAEATGEVDDPHSYPFVGCDYEPLDTCEYVSDTGELDEDGQPGTCDNPATHRVWWEGPGIDGLLVCQHHFEQVRNTITEV